MHLHVEASAIARSSAVFSSVAYSERGSTGAFFQAHVGHSFFTEIIDYSSLVVKLTA